MRRTLPLLFLALALPACAAERRTLSDPHKPSEMAASTPSSREMSVEDARKLLVAAGIEGAPVEGAQGSLDDALAILKSDELAQFSKGLSCAKGAIRGKDGKKAAALAAQIEIAWGENLRIVA